MTIRITVFRKLTVVQVSIKERFCPHLQAALVKECK